MDQNTRKKMGFSIYATIITHREITGNDIRLAKYRIMLAAIGVNFRSTIFKSRCYRTFGGEYAQLAK